MSLDQKSDSKPMGYTISWMSDRDTIDGYFSNNNYMHELNVVNKELLKERFIDALVIFRLINTENNIDIMIAVLLDIQEDAKRIRHPESEIDKPAEFTQLQLLRFHGINVGKVIKYPPQIIEDPQDLILQDTLNIQSITRHTIYYDAELKFDKITNDTSVRPHILCINWMCSCGERFSVNTITDSMDIYCTSDQSLSLFMLSVMRHNPTFIVAHNGYAYDNDRFLEGLLLREDKEIELDLYKYFFPINLPNVFPGRVSAPGHIIKLPGIYNMDSMIFTKKYMILKYQENNLNSLALTNGLKPKTLHPDFTNELTRGESRLMIEYCYHDCELTMQICDIDKAFTLISEMADISGTDMENVMRGNQGRISLNAFNKICFNRYGCFINWNNKKNRSNDEYVMKIIGGCVYHVTPTSVDNVICVDFNSLYPSLMSVYSPESVVFTETVPDEDTNFSYDWSSNGDVAFQVENKLCEFRPRNGILGKIAKFLVEERVRVGKYSPRGSMLKILANSLYGMLSSPSFESFSPYVASAITGTGRYSLHALLVTSLMLGPSSGIYGDTDSIMVSSNGIDKKCRYFHIERDKVGKEISRHITPELTQEDIAGWLKNSCHIVMQFLGLPSLKVSIDGYYKRFLSIKPKMYLALKQEDKKDFSRGEKIVFEDERRILEGKRVNTDLMEVHNNRFMKICDRYIVYKGISIKRRDGWAPKNSLYKSIAVSFCLNDEKHIIYDLRMLLDRLKLSIIEEYNKKRLTYLETEKKINILYETCDDIFKCWNINDPYTIRGDIITEYTHIKPVIDYMYTRTNDYSRIRQFHQRIINALEKMNNYEL